MTNTSLHIHCDMRADCLSVISHLDNKGFVYCTKHGLDRRWSGVPCRKLRPYELRRLFRGEQIAHY